MYIRSIFGLTLYAVLTFGLAAWAHAQSLGTGFTYQGSLQQSGVAFTGTPSMRFGLWDAAATGTGTELFFVVVPAVNVNTGLFTVALDFGGAAFAGQERWLEIGVDAAGGTAFTTLTPRQRVTAAPNALFSRRAPWAGLDGIPAGFGDDVDNIGAAGTGLLLVGNQFSVAGSHRLPQACPSNVTPLWDGDSWECGSAVVSDHGSLSGLADDDHTQYVLASGARPLTGALDLGGNAISNPGLIGGVSISAHSARHAPGGADALATDAPVDIGSTNAAGSSTSLARADHVHAHAAQAGGTQHAAATPATAGFLSGADKTKLDGLAPAGGYLFAYSTNSQVAPLNSYVGIVFNTIGVVDNWVLNATDATTLLSGTYLIQYGMSARKTGGGIASFSARLVRNGVEVAGSQASIDLDTSFVSSALSHTVLADLIAGDVVSAQIAASSFNVQITAGGLGTTPISATLTITRLR